MNENDAPAPDPGIPPILAEIAVAPSPSKRKWRWAIHLFLLAGYVLGLGLIGREIRDVDAGDAALPANTHGLLVMCASEMLLFGLVFFVAWIFSRATASQLFLKWRGGLKPILWGVAGSVALRVAITIVVIALLVPYLAIKGEKHPEKTIEKFRPKIEAVISPQALKDRTYFILMLTLVSFVLAGLREELWRAGIIAGLAALAPPIFASRRGQFLAVLCAAVIFGIGHAPQGAGAIALTGLLGIGLGSIMIWRQSIWEAVLAHGFFDATTFVALWYMEQHPDLLKAFGIS